MGTATEPADDLFEILDEQRRRAVARVERLRTDLAELRRSLTANDEHGDEEENEEELARLRALADVAVRAVNELAFAFARRVVSRVGRLERLVAQLRNLAATVSPPPGARAVSAVRPGRATRRTDAAAAPQIAATRGPRRTAKAASAAVSPRSSPATNPHWPSTPYP
jgi:hypothetical protein